MVIGSGRSTGGGATAPKTSSKPTEKLKHQNEKNKNPVLEENLFDVVSSATAAVHTFLRRNDLLLLPSQSLSLESLLSSLPIPPHRSPDHSPWFHRFLCSASADDGDQRWILYFGMSRPTFSLLLSILSPSLLPSTLPYPPPDYALASTLFRLSHAASYESLALRFGFLSSADASRAFYIVCKLIIDKLGFLDEPRSEFSPLLLPNCCGVLGFGRFDVDGEILGQNGSLLVQALVGSDGRFLDISAGWPSTVKPETIFRQTKLYSRVEDSGDFLKGPSYNLSNGVSIPQYILGDSCFPLLPWLMTPYNMSSNDEEDSFENSQRQFNNVHGRAMLVVANAFVRVRSRWQILRRKWKQETIEFLPFVITTGCLLHNFLINCGENMLDDNDNNTNNNSSVAWVKKDEEEDEEETMEFVGEVDFGARRIRDAIAKNLSRVSLRS